MHSGPWGFPMARIRALLFSHWRNLSLVNIERLSHALGLRIWQLFQRMEGSEGL